MYKIIPDALLSDGYISSLFKSRHITNFHTACDFIWKLPYGRTSDPYNFKLVLSEQIGTCSSKHGLLKLLIDELGLDVELVVGIYAMTESNTPGVGLVLGKSKYDHVPEAHCYLRYNSHRIDLTRYETTAEAPIDQFFTETPFLVTELALNKVKMHKQFLVDKYGKAESEKIWQIREQCISALST